MASVNKVILVGNVGRDPESRSMPSSGEMVCNISIATSDTYKDKQTGESKTLTEWHRVAFFGRTAEVAQQYLKKGSQCYVEGRLRTRKWTDASGQEKYSTEIVADKLQLLGNKADGENHVGGTDFSQPPVKQTQQKPVWPQNPVPADRSQIGGGFIADDIPFNKLRMHE